MALSSAVALADGVDPAPWISAPAGTVPETFVVYLAGTEEVDVIDEKGAAVPFERTPVPGQLSPVFALRVHATDGAQVRIVVKDTWGLAAKNRWGTPPFVHGPYLVRRAWRPTGAPAEIESVRRDWGIRVNRIAFLRVRAVGSACRLEVSSSVGQRSIIAPVGTTAWLGYGLGLAPNYEWEKVMGPVDVRVVALEFDGSEAPPSAPVRIRPPLDPFSRTIMLDEALDAILEHPARAFLTLAGIFAGVVVLAVFARRQAKRG